MNALLTKLDNITIPHTQIPEADLTHVDYLRERHLKAPNKDVTRAREALAALEYPTPWLERHIEDFNRTLERNVTSLRETFVSKAIDYFNNKYTLGLNSNSAIYETGITRSDTTPSNEDLMQLTLDYVMDQLNGRSFEQVAKDNFTAEFRKTAYGIKHSRRQVTLSRYVSTRDDYRGGIALGYSAYEELTLLCRAITAFVTNHASYRDDTIFNPAQYHHGNQAPFGNALETGTTDRHPKITLYMNGNARVAFNDEATAAEFITFYDLHDRIN